MRFNISSEIHKIKYLFLSMRDQVDSDITFYMYAAFDFIERALNTSVGRAKILVHCYKVTL
jgi:protein-tyrosine phosphatase